MTTTTDPAERLAVLRDTPKLCLRLTDRAATDLVLGRSGQPAAAYADARNRLWLTAAAALTAAARLTLPAGGRLDFAEFLTDTLAAVTANMGGVEELLAGRAGSWEAGLVDQLVTGALATARPTPS